MDNIQRSNLDAFNRLQSFNTKYSIDLATIVEYAPEQTIFDGAVQAIKDAGATQLQAGTTQTESLAAKDAMATIVTKYCLRGGVLARSANNTELASKLQGSAHTISDANKTDALSFARNKRDALYSNAGYNSGILTNISAGNIQEIDDAITAYDVIKDAPIINVQTKKSTATDLLAGYFSTADNAATSMYDLVQSYFSDSAEMLLAMETAMQVIVTGKHSTSITFKALADEDGSAINFVVVDKANNKAYSSNEKHEANIAHHKHGKDFHFTLSSSGRTDVDFGTDIKQGTNNVFTVRLKKA